MAVPQICNISYTKVSSQRSRLGDLTLTQIKVAVKQAFDTIDAVIFEAALAVNAKETQYKQKEYAS